MKRNSSRLTDGISRILITVMGIVMMIAGIRLLVMGVDNFIQPIRHADWVTTSANVTDISETVIKNNFFRNKRTNIHYTWTYEYVVDGTHYTGEFGPLANSVMVGKSIQIKYDPDAPENSTGFIKQSFSDIVLAVIGLVVAVLGFFLSGAFALLRKALRRDTSDGTEMSEEERRAHAQTVCEIKEQIQYTLRLLLWGAAIMLFIWILMHVQKLWL